MKPVQASCKAPLSLDDFMRGHAVWDPMPVWDGQRYLLYVLAMDRYAGLAGGSFFAHKNAIHAFESNDLKTWWHLGVALSAPSPQVRLCAGNPIVHDGRIWFFGSETIEQIDEQHLDQRLFLAVSNDGLNFDRVPDFRLEPDARIVAHNRFHPVDGRMLFAWRDPWPLWDPSTERFYVFTCTGGDRWGVAPNVVVASSAELVGPYALHGSVLDMPLNADRESSTVFGEVERVNVLASDGRFLLTFSCWRHLVRPEALNRIHGNSLALADSSVYLAEADSITGPFRFSDGRSPIVTGSHRSGFYGSTFFSREPNDLMSIGWDWNSFRIEFPRLAHARIEPNPVEAGSSLTMHWPLRRHVADCLQGGVTLMAGLGNKSSTRSQELPSPRGGDVMSFQVIELLSQYLDMAAKEQRYSSVVQVGAGCPDITSALLRGIAAIPDRKLFVVNGHDLSKGTDAGGREEIGRRVADFGIGGHLATDLIHHLSVDSVTAARDWSSAIGILKIDGGRDHESVARDLICWVPYIEPDGLLIIDGLEAAHQSQTVIGDNLRLSEFRTVAQAESVIVLKKLRGPRTLYLCGGLQSSGSTLVSWSFLQRPDLDGVLDMDNSVIHQDLSRVRTDSVWLKMTIGAFRLAEVAELFAAQGWTVKPILVTRNLEEVCASLQGKAYGVDGCTGDEPPLFLRIRRYLADLAVAKANSWPLIDYDALVDDPKRELSRACAKLGLPWDEAMLIWPKDQESIAYAMNGNGSFHRSRGQHRGFREAVAEFRKRKSDARVLDRSSLNEMLIAAQQAGNWSFSNGEDTGQRGLRLAPSKYWGTRHQKTDAEVRDLQLRLETAEGRLYRIVNHIVFGPLLRFWRRVVNRDFPAADDSHRS